MLEPTNSSLIESWAVRSTPDKWEEEGRQLGVIGFVIGAPRILNDNLSGAAITETQEINDAIFLQIIDRPHKAMIDTVIGSGGQGIGIIEDNKGGITANWSQIINLLGRINLADFAGQIHFEVQLLRFFSGNWQSGQKAR